MKMEEVGMSKHFTMFLCTICATILLCRQLNADQETNLDRLEELLLKDRWDCKVPEIPDGMTADEYVMLPLRQFAAESGIGTNEACNAIYSLLKRNWHKAAVYTKWERSALSRTGEPCIRKIVLEESAELEWIVSYADMIPDDGKREEIRLMALASSNTVLLSTGFDMTLIKPELSTNELFEIHDSLTASTNRIWTMSALERLYTDEEEIRWSKRGSNLWFKANSDPVFKDRLNRLYWFTANLLPGLSTPFDERLVASVPGYESSMQRKELYRARHEQYSIEGRLVIWNKYFQPILDRLNAIPVNELNDVSAALSWQ